MSAVDESGAASIINDTASIQPATNHHAMTPAIDFIGGVAGGVASVYVGQSLDTVKVKMQTFPHLYKNSWDCFTRTLRREGVVRGLYAGTVPSLAAQVSENAILFMAYGMCQRVVATLAGKRDVDELNPVQNAAAGGCAAFFSSLVLCPTELIKCKLQAIEQLKETGHLNGGKLPPKMGAWTLTKQIVRTEGFRGLFRGLSPTFAREMPGYFFFFGGYEAARYMMTPLGKTKEDLSPLQTMLCGGLGGASLWIAVFPADVIKSRAQVATAGSKETPFFTMLLKIMRQEGVRALYKGLGPTLLRTFPATGALFLAFETSKRLLTPKPGAAYESS